MDKLAHLGPEIKTGITCMVREIYLGLEYGLGVGTALGLANNGLQAVQKGDHIPQGLKPVYL